jgi:hypothetical protein
MPRYQDASIQFDVPRDWEDRTIVVFSAPARPGQERTTNIVVTREALDGDDTLESYADHQLELLADRMDDFELGERESRPIGGRPATLLRITSSSDGVSFEQRMALVELAGRVVATFTLTIPEQDVAQMAPLYERILGTIRIGNPKAEPTP